MNWQAVNIRPVEDGRGEYDFDATLRRHGLGPLVREKAVTLQVNLGKLCNQACHHCHVDAGPNRIEMMTRATAERVASILAQSPAVEALDLTGGAPELNLNFRLLVERARSHGRRVMVRCNLTVLFTPGMEGLVDFYRDHQVDLVCSLPCYTVQNVDAQRGSGVFGKSIEALRILNRAGFGRSGSALKLDLVYNPLGPTLPPLQAALEVRYREELGVRFGIEFNRLLTITNMPIKRFAEQLRRLGKQEDYAALLVNHFNAKTVDALMCRHLVSVGWDGVLYDCDFNQMLELAIEADGGHKPLTIWDVDDLSSLSATPIITATHCFGCTAGAGSSCGGALD